MPRTATCWLPFLCSHGRSSFLALPSSLPGLTGSQPPGTGGRQWALPSRPVPSGDGTSVKLCRKARAAKEGQQPHGAALTQDPLAELRCWLVATPWAPPVPWDAGGNGCVALAGLRSRGCAAGRLASGVPCQQPCPQPCPRPCQLPQSGSSRRSCLESCRLAEHTGQGSSAQQHRQAGPTPRRIPLPSGSAGCAPVGVWGWGAVGGTARGSGAEHLPCRETTWIQLAPKRLNLSNRLVRPSLRIYLLSAFQEHMDKIPLSGTYIYSIYY